MECLSGIISVLMMIGTLFSEDKPTSARMIAFISLLIIVLIIIVVFITAFNQPYLSNPYG